LLFANSSGLVRRRAAGTFVFYCAYYNVRDFQKKSMVRCMALGKLRAPECLQLNFHFLGIDDSAFVSDLDEPEDSIYVALGSDLFRCGADGGSSWFYRNRSCGGRRGQDPFLYLCHFVRFVFVGPRCAQTLSQADKGWVVLINKVEAWECEAER
jgi:hypothetical protein